MAPSKHGGRWATTADAEETPAIDALDSLFRINEVFLFDDAEVYCSESGHSVLDVDSTAEAMDDYTSDEDLELVKEMDALGLPTSFSTTKEKNLSASGKRKGAWVKSASNNAKNRAVNRVSDLESIASSRVLSDSTNTYTCPDPFRLDASYNFSQEVHDSGSTQVGTDMSMVVSIHHDISKKQITCDSYTAVSPVSDLENRSENLVLPHCLDPDEANSKVYHEGSLSNNQDGASSSRILSASGHKVDAVNNNPESSDADGYVCYEIDDWKVAWDAFYKRYYFYNSSTEESTWDPPTGLENFAYSAEFPGGAAVEGPDVEPQNNIRGDANCLDDRADHKEDQTSQYAFENAATSISKPGTCSIGTVLQHEDIRNDGTELELQQEDTSISPSIAKYWYQRYLLFSRFDDGIKMDKEGWFSVTPEVIANHHACHCGGSIIIDCFCGVGGNAIQFALKGYLVIAIDIDPLKIDYARHNASIYGVHNMIDFLIGDCLEVAPKLKGDVVFLSPPWGGPGYLKVQSYKLDMLRPCDGYFLFKIAIKIAPMVVMFLPRNVDLNQLAELALSTYPPYSVEVEKIFLMAS